MPASLLENLNQLDLQIYRSIASHPGLGSLEDIELQTSEKYIRLRGKVSSYFEKQLVQQTVRDFDQQRQIENELQVIWS